MQQKNVSIEAFRFIFMVLLCFWHMETSIHFQYHGYLVVEFFFMLSGALMYKSFLRHPNIGVLDFTIKRFKRFWIEYIITLIPTFFMYYHGTMEIMSEGTESLTENIFGFILQLISDSSMIRGNVFPAMGNCPTWYLQVLLISGGLLYSLLRNYPKQSITLIIPVACLWIYGYFFPPGQLVSIERWNSPSGLSMPILRGFADMGLGILLYYVFLRKKEYFSLHHRLWDILSIISLGFFILLLLFKVQKDVYAIFFLPFFIVELMNEKSCWNKWFSSKFWLFLGGISYEMLLVHMFVRGPFIYFGIYEWMNPWLMGGIYISLVLVSSYILKQVGIAIRRKLNW